MQRKQRNACHNIRFLLLTLLIVTLAALTIRTGYAADYERFIFRPPAQQESFLDKYVLKHFQQKLFDGSYAIIIGVGDYDNLSKLESVRHDVEKMKNFLLNTAEYDEVVVLTDADADFATIRYFMEEYFPQKMTRNRYRFLFYFSGHGTQREGYGGATLGFLQLQGATREPNVQSINMRHIESWAMQLPRATHTLFLLDACFSGLAGTEDKSYETGTDPIELAQENGRFMITAGGADETSIASLSRWGGSLFTDVVISGMQGDADFDKDGVVTMYELFTYTQAAVRNESRKVRHAQHPLISNLGGYTDKGQYFFVYQDPSPPDMPTVTVLDDQEKKRVDLQAAIGQLLQECEQHFEADRLTTGQGGTALECYRQVLELDPANAEALAGLDRIEAQYAEWAQQALQQGRNDKVRQYLERLQLVNPESPALAEFLAALQPLTPTPTPEPSTPTPGIASALHLRSEPITVSEEEYQNVFGLDETKRPLEYSGNNFDVLGDVVVDHVTGLMWQRSGSEHSRPCQDTQEYIKQLNKQQFAGYNDWRLPTIPELMSLIEPEEQESGLYIDPVFDKTQEWCWSADRLSEDASPELAWYVDFLYGDVFRNDPDDDYYVRAVRSTSEPPTATSRIPSVLHLRNEPKTVSDAEALDEFGLEAVKNGDDTVRRLVEYVENDFDDQGDVVIDLATGLMWQKSGSENYVTYQEALAYIQQLNQEKFAGYTDWRLPTVPELMSLLEQEKQSNGLYINPIFDSQQRWCWSADRQPKGNDSPESAWGVSSDFGKVTWEYIHYAFSVRAVRSWP